MSRLEDALVAFDQAAATTRRTPWPGRAAASRWPGWAGPTEALQSFDKALAVDPRAPLPRFHAAEVLEQLGRNEDAAKAYQQFLGVASPAVLAGQTQRARKRLAELRGGGA